MKKEIKEKKNGDIIGVECYAYFRDKDGSGTCNTKCQWWVVVCDKNDRTSVHNTYERAVEQRKMLNEEYKGFCKHKIIKVKVILKSK